MEVKERAKNSPGLKKTKKTWQLSDSELDPFAIMDLLRQLVKLELGLSLRVGYVRSLIMVV